MQTFENTTRRIPEKLSKTTIKLREFAWAINDRLWPTIVEDPNHVLTIASENAERGRGNVIVITHFGYGDAMKVLAEIIFHTPGIKDRFVISPQSQHQYKSVLNRAVSYFGGSLLPVVNDKSREKLKMNASERRKFELGLLKNFIATSNKVLQVGGTVVIAINAGRKPYLELDGKEEPMKMFIDQMKKNGVPYDITTMALAIVGATDYSKYRGLNFSHQYQITVGEHIPHEQIDELGNNPDLVLRQKIDTIITPDYRDPQRKSIQ